jgi:hypothetical protein
MVRPDVPHTNGRRLLVGAAAIVLGIFAVAVVTYLVGLSGGPSTVARITFVNPTAYSLDVEVSPGTGSSWSSAGFVPKESTAVVEEIPDQGAVWVFRFDAQGHSGGEIHMIRAELQRNGWRIDIPAEIGRRLADAGAPPTP